MKIARNNCTRSLLTVVAIAAAGLLTGCAHDHHVHPAPTITTYSMVAYGESGYCYYIDDPSEATALLAAGRCPAGWVPYRAPLVWEQTYWAYYSSPSYVNVYVPANSRTV